MTYATDTDLLHYEPDLFRNTTLVSQTLMSGVADVSGSTLTIPAGSFAGIRAGHVVTLSGSIAGSFPVLAVDSTTQLTISAMYDRLKPEDDDTPPSPIGQGLAVPFAIKTFLPQIGLISELLRRVLGVDDPQQVLTPQALRAPATVGTLHLLFSALGGLLVDDVQARARAVWYERIYHRLLRSTRVRLDLNNDRITDTVRCPGVIQLHRAA